MSETGWTPGPWRLEGDRTFYLRAGYEPAAVVPIPGEILFYRTWGPSLDYEVAKANARLITMAPALYRELERGVAQVISEDGVCCICGQECSSHASGCPVPGATAALAMARGPES